MIWTLLTLLLPVVLENARKHLGGCAEEAVELYTSLKTKVGMKLTLKWKMAQKRSKKTYLLTATRTIDGSDFMVL